MENKMQQKTVGQLDVRRYMGLWYEIARYDHRFERGMSDVTAEYTLRENGMISVVNSGMKDGKRHVARGKAKMPDKSQPGRLKVSFFLWFYSDYYILELAEDYSYVLIGSSSDKYLWILSRTSQLGETSKNFLLSRAQQRGYDTSKLLWVEQSR